MNGVMIVAIVVAIGFVAFGLQVLSQQIQRTPVDVRRPDPLIDVSSATSVSVRPAEFHQLVGIISNSLISDASARTELQPILDQLDLGRSSPGPPAPTGNRKGRRLRRIELAVTDLERQWGLDDDRMS